RVAAGPRAADRMVAIDLLGLLVAVLMVSHAIRTNDESVFDVVLVFAVVAFFGTVALARFLLTGPRDSDNDRKDDDDCNSGIGLPADRRVLFAGRRAGRIPLSRFLFAGARGDEGEHVRDWIHGAGGSAGAGDGIGLDQGGG